MSVFDGLADVFTNALGQTVTVTPAGEAAREITAMVVSRAVDDIGIVQQRPAIHARSVDVVDLADGDAVTIDGVAYTARVFRPDGRGMTTILLERG